MFTQHTRRRVTDDQSAPIDEMRCDCCHTSFDIKENTLIAGTKALCICPCCGSPSGSFSIVPDVLTSFDSTTSACPLDEHELVAVLI